MNPHADLKELYFQDWRENTYPWKLWQCCPASIEGRIEADWADLTDHPIWSASFIYRRKRQLILINGYEIPVPMTFQELILLPDRQTVFVVDLTCSDGYDEVPVNNYELADWDLLCDRGLVHATESAAEIHAKALIGITTRALKTFKALN